MAKIESEEDLKRQMRRRLVGAVALVTALVVILPMLLANSPKPREGQLELRIPDKDTSGAFTSQMVVAESAPDVTPLPPPDAAQPAVTPSGAAVQPPKPAQAAPGAAEHAASTGAKPAGTKAGARKSAEHKPAAAHKAAEHKPGFAVQVGAFSHAAAARELQDKLRQQGWHAYTQKAGGAVRVRVGPYAARGAAEQAQHKLAAQGVKPAAVVAEP